MYGISKERYSKIRYSAIAPILSYCLLLGKVMCNKLKKDE